VRDKRQQGSFFSPFQESYVDSKLLTWSITPRVNIKNDVFGYRSNILTGIDYYDSKYDSDRSQFQGLSPIHVYNLTQRSVGGYWQQSIGFTPTTDFSYGARVQDISITARDRYDPTAPAPAFSSSAQDLPLNSSEVQYALHTGFEHRFTD